MPIDFRVASAEGLPFEDESFDVCMTIELIEHVESWQRCLDEVCRVVRPGGMLVLTTSNVMCPVQHEYRLPMYSWWPAPLKRVGFRLASTKYPALANYSPCPARHWFTVFQLESELERRGMQAFDRLDMMDLKNRPAAVATLIEAARHNRIVKALLYLFLTGTIVFGVKKDHH
jgi:2-polyprenyl-6-hydroxyphenyl methylase/3-demethylubiquinone-9 3-methyltransferase